MAESFKSERGVVAAQGFKSDRIQFDRIKFDRIKSDRIKSDTWLVA